MFDTFPKPVPDSIGRIIKSVQSGTAILATASASVNIPISTVDLNRAIVIVQSYSHSSASTPSQQIALRGVIDSPTNVLLTRSSSGAAITYTWTVIEFASVTRLQKGQKVLGATSDTVTVSPVNTAKALLFYSFSSNGLVTGGVNPLIGYITNATTLTFNQQAATPTATIEWQLIELP